MYVPAYTVTAVISSRNKWLLFPPVYNWFLGSPCSFCGQKNIVPKVLSERLQECYRVAKTVETKWVNKVFLRLVRCTPVAVDLFHPTYNIQIYNWLVGAHLVFLRLVRCGQSISARAWMNYAPERYGMTGFDLGKQTTREVFGSGISSLNRCMCTGGGWNKVFLPFFYPLKIWGKWN